METIAQYCAPGASVEEKFIETVPGIRLRVFDIKPAQLVPHHPEVIFIPGWITQPIAWKNVLKRWSQDFRIHYVETREKISSRIEGRQPLGVEDLGNDIVRLIDQLDLQDRQFLLFGSSLGATVILDCVNSLNRQPLALILVGPNAEFRVPRWGMVIIRLFYPGFYAALKPVIKWYLKNFRLDVEADYAQYEKYGRALDAADPWKLKKAVIPFSKYKVWPLLENIQANVLIVGASKDKLHEPENLKKMISLLPNARYLDLETNQGTHSEQLVTEIRRYLNSLPDYSCNCENCSTENG